MRGLSGCAIAALVACGPSVSIIEAGDSSETGEIVEGTTTAFTASGGTSGGGLDTTGPTDRETTSGGSTGLVDDSTGEDSSESSGEPPSAPSLSRVLFFYTPHGFYADDAWLGTEDAITLGPMLDSLEPWQAQVLIVDGISNHSADPEGIDVPDAHSTAAAGLLTGGLLGSGSTNDPMFDPHFAGGPSLDVVLADLLPRTLHGAIHLGVRAGPTSMPLGVSYLGADQPHEPTTNPQLAFDALFSAEPSDPFLDEVQDRIDAAVGSPLAVLDAQLAIARAAFALDLSRSQLVSMDVAIPQIVWTEFGHTDPFHWPISYNEPGTGDVIAAWGDVFGAFVADLAETPAPEGGTLLDSTLLVWVSEFGSIPAAHSRNAVLCVIVDTTGTFDTGGAIEVEATQADLAYTIAAAMDVELGSFGDPGLAGSVIDTLLAP